MNLKIACDNHVSLENIERLKFMGYSVVFRAWHETDWSWCNEALEKGANVFISCDWDIEFFCNTNNASCIRLPQNKGGKAQLNYITNRLKKLKKQIKVANDKGRS